MKETLRLEKEHEVLSLITGISYCHVPAWYGATMRDLKMDLIVPKHREGHSACPVILWICGGAYMVVDKSVWMPEMVYFARHGFVIASIEYRTSNEAQFPAQLIDVKAAIRFLKKHAEEFCIDPGQITVMGESAGGALACLAGVTHKHKEFDIGDYPELDCSVKNVVDFYGPAAVQEPDHTASADDSLPAAGDHVPDWTLDAYLGSGFTEEKYRSCCAETYLVELNVDELPSFMILQGKDDPVVAEKVSDRFYDRLVKCGADVNYVLIEGAVHGDDLLYQDVIKERIVKFLNK